MWHWHTFATWMQHFTAMQTMEILKLGCELSGMHTYKNPNKVWNFYFIRKNHVCCLCNYLEGLLTYSSSETILIGFLHTLYVPKYMECNCNGWSTVFNLTWRQNMFMKRKQCVLNTFKLWIESLSVLYILIRGGTIYTLILKLSNHLVLFPWMFYGLKIDF